MTPTDHATRHRIALAAVAAAFLAVTVAIGSLRRHINWDEAIVLSQLWPDVPTIFLEPHRTRGLSLLLAPITLWSPPIAVLRGVTLLLVAAGLYAAYSSWRRVLGAAAPVAAVLFAGWFVVLARAYEVIPSVPSGIAAAGAVGAAVRHVTEDRVPRVATLSLLAWMAFYASIRPSDAFLTGLGLAVGLLVVTRDARAVRAAVVAAAGGLVGVVPWLVEGFVRFGYSPLQLLRGAGDFSVGGQVRGQLPLYVRSLEGPQRCVEECLAAYVADRGWGLPPTGTTLVLLVMVVLAAVALGAAIGRHRDSRPDPRLDTAAGVRPGALTAIVVAVAAAAPVVAFYGTTGSPMNLRYLLPATALLVVPVAVGGVVVARWSATRIAPPAAAVLVVPLVVALAWQVGLARAELGGFSAPATAARAGAYLGDLAGDQPCVIVAQNYFPQLQFASGCTTILASELGDGSLQPPVGSYGAYADVTALAAEGAVVFGAWVGTPIEGTPIRDWDQLTVVDDRLQLFALPDGQGLPETPCPDPALPPHSLQHRLAPERCPAG